MPPANLHRGYPFFPGQFWDHYTELPDIYDRFATSTDVGVDFLSTLIDFSGAAVLDIAAGTGRTAFAAAKRAASVVGVEPEQPMREFAVRKQRLEGVSNVEFLPGRTDNMPSLPPRSFDVVTCFHGPPFLPGDVPTFVQVLAPLVRPGGSIVVQWTTPNWLHQFQQSLPADAPERAMVSDPTLKMERAFNDAGFRHVDAVFDADHGSLDEALATYGYIYGPRAIDWLLETGSARIPWSMRTYIYTVA